MFVEEDSSCSDFEGTVKDALVDEKVETGKRVRGEPSTSCEDEYKKKMSKPTEDGRGNEMMQGICRFGMI